MRDAPLVINILVQICQHEAEQFNKSPSETDESKMTALTKIINSAISTVRDILRAVSDPKVLDKGIPSSIHSNR